MKLIASLFLLIFSTAIGQTKYYISPAGNNSNSGTSAAAPWQTIARYNSAVIASGDSVLFQSGQTFPGTVAAKQGVKYGVYGGSAPAVISAFATAASWQLHSPGIYRCLATGAPTTLNLVTVNGRPAEMGRYPNSDSANGGYLNYESFNGSTSITDNQLPAAPNWTGARVVVRKNEWSLDRCRITGHTGTTINFTTPTSNINGIGPDIWTGKAGYGYFITDDIRTLNKLHEWYYNAADGYLYMFFGNANPAGYVVKYSTADYCFNIGSRTGISLQSLSFEGANRAAVYAYQSANLTLSNCTVLNSGAVGIQTVYTGNFQANNCTVKNCLANGITAFSKRFSNIVVSGCTIDSSGMIAGMGSNFASTDYNGIYAIGSGILIEGNRITNSGKAAVYANGSNMIVRNNILLRAVYHFKDYGIFYSYVMDETYTGRIIENNIVGYSYGEVFGTSNRAAIDANGIYLDGEWMNGIVRNNTVFNCGDAGIYMNNPQNVNITGNTVWNCYKPLAFTRYDYGLISGLNVKGNTFIQLDDKSPVLYYTNQAINNPAPTTLQQWLTSSASIDSNSYYMAYPAGYQFELYSSAGGSLVPQSDLNLTTWQQFGFDATSRNIPLLPYYKIRSLVGSNKTTNGTFGSNITGYTLFGTGTGISWAAGRLKMTITAPEAGRYSLVHSRAGTVAAGKRYVMRFTVQGSNSNGLLRAYLRNSVSPWNTITDTVYCSYNAAVRAQECFFQANASTAASVCISVEKNSGTTFLDNVELWEVDGQFTDPGARVKVLINETADTRAVTFTDGTYTDFVTGSPVTAISLSAYSSRVVVQQTTSSTTAAGTTAANGTSVIFLNK